MFSFEKLEFNKIKELIKERAFTDLGKDKIDSMTPMKNLQDITSRVELISEFQSILKEGLSINLDGLTDLNGFFKEFKSTVMSFEEFQLVIANVRIGNKLAERLKDIEGYKLIKDKFNRLEALPEISARYDAIFSPDGDILDTASKELQRLRRSKRDTRAGIQRTLNSKLNDAKFEKFVQEKIITTRGDRYVIPIKEGKAKFVGGVIQERSSSGSSIYIEPPEIVEMNNKISMLKQSEKEEIFRIFKSFTDMILPLKKLLIKNTELIGKFDFFYSNASFANYLKANRVELVKEAILELKEVRHPLLIHQLQSVEKVIPYHLEMGEDYNMLILSGPNTGGKTVTLKSTGLVTIMALSGLPIPADKESKIGLFQNIVADIGDEQSIENSLSTFASHITNIKNMVECANNKTLVLIDEIGSSTDPEQGSALAQAVLEELVKAGSKGIITTHFTALKVFAEKHKSCRNASMQFDSKEHKPTYRFVFGLPGDSFAIDVADGLGLKVDIIERAKELAGTQNIELTSLIKKLEEEKKNLGQVTYKHQLQVALLKGREEEYKKKIKELEDEAKAIKKKHLEEAQRYLIDMQKELNNDLDHIKKLDKKERKEQNQKALQRLSAKHREITDRTNELSGAKTRNISSPKVGMKVWVISFETQATIAEINGKNVIVDMDGITFKTKLDNISYLDKKKETAKKDSPKVIVSQSVTPQSTFELKILGFTFDEARIEVNDFIDNANIAGLKKLRIVHGKGTGALRQKVRQHLQRIKCVKTFYTPPENAGGSGVTIVELKD